MVVGSLGSFVLFCVLFSDPEFQKNISMLLSCGGLCLPCRGDPGHRTWLSQSQLRCGAAGGQSLPRFSPEYLSLFHAPRLCTDGLLNLVCVLLCHGCLSDLLVSVFVL